MHAALRPCLSSIPDPSFRLMSRMTQTAFSKSVWLLKACADENTTGSYACCRSRRCTLLSIPGSSSTTKTRFRSFDIPHLSDDETVQHPVFTSQASPAQLVPSRVLARLKFLQV